MKLPKAYTPKDYEDDIYALWEKSGAFEPINRGGQGTYSIVVPPPNANGNLHLGHGLTLALEDIAVRYHRMTGKASLLLPGADHAGFETQVVYEKELAKQGKSRFDFSREELYQQIWDFVAQNKDNYESQFRRLGASLDWTRYTYTLDQKIVNRAYETFKKMWDDKLIYRGERLVNFCTYHGTAFADIEVAHKEVTGSIWHIRYPLTDGSGEIVVATTRPETMLGDTAVAVHPDDERYKQFVGKTIRLPLTEREIPILADTMVDREFGSGAVKITPAHDPNDYELAQRHDLPMISVIDTTGKIIHSTSDTYAGLSVKDARNRIIQDLKKQGWLTKEEPHTHNVGHCYRCDNVIEPLLREQWFVDMKPLAASAIDALEQGKITFYPANKKDQLVRYLQGLRDWNISRQIAWGIPIPAFQNTDNPDDWIFDERVSEETIEVNGKTYRRDPDVFDTWFSSGQWPYATLDYPNSQDAKDFYPLSLMETAEDILYPWVSRMIMFGLYITKDVPFKKVYLHGLIQDEHGAKMSKSKGNVVDPMTKIDEFGSDAFRMGIIADETPGNNRPYDESKIVGARNFANKLWNIARFVEDKVGQSEITAAPETQTIADHWMLSKLQHSTEKISADLESYRFSEAYDTLYHLIWDDFADWYIEASKAEPHLAMLRYSLETVLKLAHPFAPFVTEAIWQTLYPADDDTLLITTKWPQPPKADDKKANEFAAMAAIVSEIRFVISNLKRTHATLHFSDSPLIAANSDLIARLARIEVTEGQESAEGLQLTGTTDKAWLSVSREDIARFVDELETQIAGKEQAIAGLKARLDNPRYTEKAPKHLVEETHQQLEASRTQLEKLQSDLARFTN